MAQFPLVLIDDERSFKGAEGAEALVIRNSAEALAWLATLDASSVVGQLWLDHDLGIFDGKKITIMRFVRELEKRVYEGSAPEIEHVIVHTSNNVGGNEVMASLSRHFATTRVFAGDYLTVL